jgi:CBS domain-containing protein
VVDTQRVLTARDIMSKTLVTFTPETSIYEAIRTLIQRRISGAPVVSSDGQMLGVLSEHDCLRVLSSDQFYAGEQGETGLVRDFMTEPILTIPPDLDIYGVAHYFLNSPVRRLPVVEGGTLVGQVSRRDVLRGIDEISRKRLPRKSYPDYRSPA